jgi:hypothetical protein
LIFSTARKVTTAKAPKRRVARIRSNSGTRIGRRYSRPARKRFKISPHSAATASRAATANSSNFAYSAGQSLPMAYTHHGITGRRQYREIAQSVAPSSKAFSKIRQSINILHEQ